MQEFTYFSLHPIRHLPPRPNPTWQITTPPLAKSLLTQRKRNRQPYPPPETISAPSLLTCPGLLSPCAYSPSASPPCASPWTIPLSPRPFRESQMSFTVLRMWDGMALLTFLPHAVSNTPPISLLWQVPSAGGAENTRTAFQLPFGKLYKVLNPKWVFLAALLVFEIGSVVCGAAPTSTGLIIGVSFHLLPFFPCLCPHVPGASEPRFASSSQTGKNILMWKTNGFMHSAPSLAWDPLAFSAVRWSSSRTRRPWKNGPFIPASLVPCLALLLLWDLWYVPLLYPPNPTCIMSEPRFIQSDIEAKNMR